MQLRIYLQKSNFNYEKNEFYKNKTKIALPAQYSTSFPDKHPELIYIIVSIKIHIGNDMDKSPWWNCDDETITQYTGYPMNVYDDLSIDKSKKREKIGMDVSDSIVSMLYTRK